jgi:selenide,water dikinase
LGTGFITTALRGEVCPDDVLETACAGMVELNAIAAGAAIELGARAATDVTGFGLAGHAVEMAEASGVTITLDLERLPLLPGALELAREGFHTRANATNRAHVLAHAAVGEAGASDRAEFLYDPQTSGGLLIAIPVERADALRERCGPATAIIGAVEPRGETALIIR